MRILWVKVGGLWPPTTGGRVRSFHIVSALSRRHRVTLVTTHGSGDDPAGLARELPGCERVVSLPYQVPKRGSARFPLAVAGSWFSRDPVDLWKWRLPALRDRIRSLVHGGSVDVVVADFLFAAVNVPFRGAVPAILFEHNVEYLIWKRLCDIERRPWRRALLALEWRKLRAREADVCRRADLTIAVSDDDRQRLAEIAPGAGIASIPTGVDTVYFRPGAAAERPRRLVFSGSMDWQPNEDAILYYIEQIQPLIHRTDPDVTLTVVGRNPTDRLRTAAERAGVHLTGTVDDIRPAVAEAAVCIVPLRAGSGTRLKILEALAMGKAVVSTTLGAEGLSLVPGRQFVAADTPAAFADAVVSLLRDPDRRRRLAAAGRDLVERTGSWEQVARQFESLCESVVSRHGSARITAAGRPDLSRAGLA
jgi:glycosyltransferase involved in cell wall biosynthesis